MPGKESANRRDRCACGGGARPPPRALGTNFLGAVRCRLAERLELLPLSTVHDSPSPTPIKYCVLCGWTWPLGFRRLRLFFILHGKRVLLLDGFARVGIP